jgi:hypothetical protein
MPKARSSTVPMRGGVRTQEYLLEPVLRKTGHHSRVFQQATLRSGPRLFVFGEEPQSNARILNIDKSKVILKLTPYVHFKVPKGPDGQAPPPFPFLKLEKPPPPPLCFFSMYVFDLLYW